MGRLDHFRTITAYTFAHPKMADIFRNGITGLAFSVSELPPGRGAATVPIGP